MQKYILTFLLGLLICQNTSHAADIYASPSGGGSGSQDSPTSLSQAVQQAGGGDTVYLFGGEYSNYATVSGNGSADSCCYFPESQ